MMFLALVVQEFIPPLLFAHGARVFLLPVVLLYGAVALPYGHVLLFALIGGLIWDLHTLQFLGDRVEIALGWSIILFVVVCSLMHGLRPLFLRGRWEVHCFAMGLGTSMILLAEYLMITFRRGAPMFSEDVWWRIAAPGVVAMVLAPLVFAVFNQLGRMMGQNLRPEERSL